MTDCPRNIFLVTDCLYYKKILVTDCPKIRWRIVPVTICLGDGLSYDHLSGVWTRQSSMARLALISVPESRIKKIMSDSWSAAQQFLEISWLADWALVRIRPILVSNYFIKILLIIIGTYWLSTPRFSKRWKTKGGILGNRNFFTEGVYERCRRGSGTF